MIVFSELSQLNVETCIIDALRAVKITPPSILKSMSNAIKLSTTQLNEIESQRVNF
jgi:hypothetical protein